MTAAHLLTRIAAELAMFSGIGFLLFAANDLLVDGIYFVRRFWRFLTVYRRYPRAFGTTFANPAAEQRRMAIFEPARAESAAIAAMIVRTGPDRV